MTIQSNLLRSTIAALGLTVLAAVPAKAGIITTLENTVANANGSYTYTYGVLLTKGSELQGTQTDFGATQNHPVAQFATIYDFGPMIGGITFANPNSLLATLFTTSVSNISTPQTLNTNVPDSPTLANIRFTYAAPNTLIYNSTDTPTGLNMTQTAIGVSGADNLGVFSVVSPYAPGASNNLSYDSSTYNQDNYTQQGNNGLIDGPSVVIPTSVPEPASLALLGMGLVGLGVMRRRQAN